MSWKASWHDCRCGHAPDDHFRKGMLRGGPCKLDGCSCVAFEAGVPATG